MTRKTPCSSPSVSARDCGTTSPKSPDAATSRSPAFVTDALEDAVEVATNPFAGLAARMTATFRANLAKAVESGAYADAAAEVDRAEGWDKAS